MDNTFIVILSFSTLLPMLAKAQIQVRNNRYLSASIHHGKTEVHSPLVQNLNGSNPYAFELDYGMHFMTGQARNNFGCYPRIGGILSVTNYNHPVVGHGIASLFYFEPFLLIKGRWMWSIKGGAGLAWLSDPFHSKTNAQNKAYSTALNFPLTLGTYLYFLTTRHWSLKTGGVLHHLSNGGINKPNAGMTYMTFSMGIDYSFNDNTPPPKTFSKGLYLEAAERSHRFEFIFGAGLRDDSIHKTTVYILHQRYIYQLTRINAFTLGMMEEMDPSLYSEHNQIRLSCLTGHELVLGKVGFSQDLGFTLYRSSKRFPPFYQLYTLHLPVTNHIRVGIHLKAHGLKAEYLGTRISYGI